MQKLCLIYNTAPRYREAVFVQSMLNMIAIGTLVKPSLISRKWIHRC